MSASTRTPRGRCAKASPEAPSFRSRRRRMAICGWARNPDWPASMVSTPSRGSRQTGPNSPAILSSNFWLRATALSGLAQTRGLPVGRTASLRSIQESSVTAFIHCCKILEERSGLRLKTRAGSVPSESALRSVKGTGVSAFPYLPYTRTTNAICGSRLKRVCGDGPLVLQSTTDCPRAFRPPNYSKTTTVHS